MCTNTLKKYIFYMLLYSFNSFQPESLLNVMWNMRYSTEEELILHGDVYSKWFLGITSQFVLP